MSLTENQTLAIEIAERTASSFSVLGAAFIITTFVSNRRFRKPINRLVFYAAWGNLSANIGTMMSVSGVRQGSDSTLCQFQGFLVQW